MAQTITLVLSVDDAQLIAHSLHVHAIRLNNFETDAVAKKLSRIETLRSSIQRQLWAKLIPDECDIEPPLL